MKSTTTKYGVTTLNHKSGAVVTICPLFDIRTHNQVTASINGVELNKLVGITRRMIRDYVREYVTSGEVKQENGQSARNARAISISADIFEPCEIVNDALTWETKRKGRNGKPITIFKLIARAIARQIRHAKRMAEQRDSTVVELTHEDLRSNERILERIRKREDAMLLDCVLESARKLHSNSIADISTELNMTERTLYRRLQELKINYS